MWVEIYDQERTDARDDDHQDAEPNGFTGVSSFRRAALYQQSEKKS
jgi:hypothetical protein